ncbi:hypothetical protein [Ehrlichia canis]|uniref:Uncharacterized protein n=1 Tax=Ehrlichia canis (strain Jake) TaxID=269484 RepID=A0ACA6AV71_EHRCJ|nr:hypothetical protein [Ehrlichia canis]AAZ68177.1 hypothetical protein Ecaj_0126 [Ehrlichia canis str. Jake]AUO54432.1 hypothetical protein C1I72_00710 [Ehrlichia canis]UKC53036.1 hypothetical protein s20019040002_000078 [Ehrlichia canis]UKC53973.1 hypothetical protein s20026770001_000078 [Ehrlichia canis]UKC54909.1 hypothetical protein s21009500007_000078 [Ehrlichia canis]
MTSNTSIPKNHEYSFKLDIGENLYFFCNHNVHKVKIITEDNTEITMPSKNYFFVGDKFYAPYNNYFYDNYLNIPAEYRYIKVDHMQYRTTNNEQPQDFYNLVLCDKNGEEYRYNYYKFYIKPENIIEKSAEINLKEYYNIQQLKEGAPLFKIVSEQPNNTTKASTALILDISSNQKFAKLSPEALQYKHYLDRNSPTYDTFTLSYSDIRKHHVDEQEKINLHNIRDDILQAEMENNPIFLVIQDGKYFFTDVKQDQPLTTSYNTALKVLASANFQINNVPNDNCYVDMHKKFIFKITKSNLHTEHDNSKNLASITLEGKEIPLISNDDDTQIFYDDFSFKCYQNFTQVFNYDEPIIGLDKDFYEPIKEKLSSNNIYITIKSDEQNHIKTYFSDKQGNHILDLPNTKLTEYLSTMLPLGDFSNEVLNTHIEDIAHQKLSDTTQKHDTLNPEKNSTTLQNSVNETAGTNDPQSTQNAVHKHDTLDTQKDSTTSQKSVNDTASTNDSQSTQNAVHKHDTLDTQKDSTTSQKSVNETASTNDPQPTQNAVHKHDTLDTQKDSTTLQKLVSEEHNINKSNTNINVEQNIVYFPLSREHVSIVDNIEQNKHHVSFNLTYEEMLNFYEAVKEQYSYDEVLIAYNNIFKNYGREQKNDNIYIDGDNHIFIENHDFGILQ